ncbi:uncharacterized protein LOC109601698 [Aethina tumida]|uniref:uncharacterized protein LOC109601698 n=1 Tax=Aethina tumida TaxID=116153 RepID=UPI00096AF471|nr:uncharacterized protein LOC109601698 [Aethina tumida]
MGRRGPEIIYPFTVGRRGGFVKNSFEDKRVLEIMKNPGLPKYFGTFNRETLDKKILDMNKVNLKASLNTRQLPPNLTASEKRKHIRKSFKEFESRRLLEMQKDFPGVELSVLRGHLFKEWQYSPENPVGKIWDSFNQTRKGFLCYYKL